MEEIKSRLKSRVHLEQKKIHKTVVKIMNKHNNNKYKINNKQNQVIRQIRKILNKKIKIKNKFKINNKIMMIVLIQKILIYLIQVKKKKL